MAEWRKRSVSTWPMPAIAKKNPKDSLMDKENYNKDMIDRDGTERRTISGKRLVERLVESNKGRVQRTGALAEKRRGQILSNAIDKTLNTARTPQAMWRIDV